MIRPPYLNPMVRYTGLMYYSNMLIYTVLLRRYVLSLH
jgi:hypothetical protein